MSGRPLPISRTRWLSLVLGLMIPGSCSRTDSDDAHPIEITITLESGESLGDDTLVTILGPAGTSVAEITFSAAYDYSGLATADDPYAPPPGSGAPTAHTVELPAAGEYRFRTTEKTVGPNNGTSACFYEGNETKRLVKDGDTVELPTGALSGCS